MGYRSLSIFVEGITDERFFENVMVNQLKQQFNQVRIIKYATLKPTKVSALVRGFKSFDGASVMFTADYDSKPSLGTRIHEITSKYDEVNRHDICLVIDEIESWFLAGLSFEHCERLGVNYVKHTEHITKEDFFSLIPPHFDSRLDFLFEIIKVFNIRTARKRNASFAFFLDMLERLAI